MDQDLVRAARAMLAWSLMSGPPPFDDVRTQVISKRVLEMQRDETMKKETMADMEDDLLRNYDLAELLEDGVRGKYAEQYRAGVNPVRLDADVALAFPT